MLGLIKIGRGVEHAYLINTNQNGSYAYVCSFFEIPYTYICTTHKIPKLFRIIPHKLVS